jgi:hypothetical protein
LLVASCATFGLFIKDHFPVTGSSEQQLAAQDGDLGFGGAATGGNIAHESELGWQKRQD